MAKALFFVVLGMLLATALNSGGQRVVIKDHKLKCIKGGIDD